MRSTALSLFPIPLAAALALAMAAHAAPPDPSSIRTDPRLVATLWASEPQVVDPVALCFDARGVAYVAECRDYPYGDPDSPDGGSTVRRLEDTDGDGHPDRITLFASGLGYATSVTPWRDGILVVAPPDIVWLADSDGDGVADVLRVVLTGLRRGVSDSLANGLRYGIDNRIHVANGGNGGRVRTPDPVGEALELDGDDFAFVPFGGPPARTGQTGGGFGLVADAWGRWFTTYNIDHIQHRFIDRHLARRHPGFPPVALTESVSDHGEMARIHPISAALTRPNHPEQAGHFSAAGGVGYIGAEGWPGDLAGSVLIGDVVGNLFHREVIRPDGPGFRAHRGEGEETREFLASVDPAFRPVAFEEGPDGALYVLDMHREVIEHPDYIPAAVRNGLDLRAGADRGRIYRVAPKGLAPRERPRLGDASDADLVARLGHGDPWWRTTAQRLLVERRATNAVPALRQQLQSSGNPLHRLHALWTLEGLGRLDMNDIRDALIDAEPRVRENALILAGRHLPEAPFLLGRVREQTLHADPRVRFHAALALGAASGAESAGALVNVLRLDHRHPWSRRAVLAGIAPGDLRQVLQQVLADRRFIDRVADTRTEALGELAELAGARAGDRPDDLSWLLGRIDFRFPENVRIALFTGIARGLERSGARPRLSEAARRSVEKAPIRAGAAEVTAAWDLHRLLGIPESPPLRSALSTALRHATNRAGSVAERTEWIPVLRFGEPSATTPTLLSLLDGLEPAEVQQAALGVLRTRTEPEVGTALAGRWRSVAPGLRPAVVQLLVGRRPFHDALLSALEAERIRVGELNLDLEQRRRLLRGGEAAIRERAARFFSDEEYSNRSGIVAEWLARLPASGDPARGRVIFGESCAPCHRMAGTGQVVGPDLAGVAHRSVEDLLGNILDPNMALNPGFVAYTAETDDGENHTGLLSASTAESITLVQAGGIRVVLPRSRVRSLGSEGTSLMPAGLEAGRTPQDLRDLIAFLQSSP